MDVPLPPVSEPVTDTVSDSRAGVVISQVTFERVVLTPDHGEIVVVMDGELRYETADPFAVTLTFVSMAGPVRWCLARDLLMTGCYLPAGKGDVRVQPSLGEMGRSMVRLELSSPEGDAIVTTPTADVVAFVQRMLAAVPAGAESAHLDVDNTIARLLPGA